MPDMAGKAQFAFSIVVWLFCIWAGARIALRQGRPAVHGVLWGFFCGPLGLVILTLLPRPRDKLAEALERLREGDSAADSCVELEGTQTGDDDLGRLADAGGGAIVELRLGATRVTDAGLMHLKHLPALELLDLSRTAVTDDGLDLLLALPRLTTLWIGGTAVSDAGLQRLAKLASLRELHAVNTRVTPEGVRDFQAMRPNCRVDV